MSIDINSFLGGFERDLKAHYAQQKSGKTTTSSTSASGSANYDSSIFERASAIVAEYKSKQSEDESSGSKKTSFVGGLNFAQIANMSTKDFLNYAYENKATSGFSESSAEENKEGNENGATNTNIKLPMLVRYKGMVVSTAGKSFMAVVAKIKAKYPHRSEEEIAAELISKYDNNSGSTNKTSGSSNKQTTGSSLNLSA